ncbi:MAG: ligase-associated DNA damage response endonuclease PdeM [Alphaproteobacteria bacterium]|jgi:DNA ligase-associated metallophosphoesterase|nr:ligase-associated DNA damage response endonuclease PdeM [Alphaproteobacteria bacterium]
MSVAVTLNQATLALDPSGALWWPARQVLAVADLHLEKGSGFAARGRLLPPYDTAATLARLAALVARYRPATVVCVGDSFHDGRAAGRLAPADGARLQALTASCTWVWVVGNHDPAPPTAWGGRVETELTLGPLVFRHQARPGGAGEVSGHFHPRAAVHVRDRRLTAPCYAGDGRRLILPAFGAYTGGLDVLDPAIAGLLARPFTVHMLGRDRLYPLSSARLAAPRRRSVAAARRPDAARDRP